jgi:hypothetical protein
MQISNVLSGFTDAAKMGKQAASSAGNILKSLKPSDPTAQPTSDARAAMNDILRKYDVTNITPEELSQMLAKLRDTGAISEQDFQELSAIRTDLESQGVASDQSVNLVERYSDQVKKLQQQLGDKPNTVGAKMLAPAMSKLDWMQKFALIHSNPEGAGIDLAA